jgi:hypothetical protein
MRSKIEGEGKEKVDELSFFYLIIIFMLKEGFSVFWRLVLKEK